MKQNLSEQEKHEERQTLLRIMAILPPQKIGWIFDLKLSEEHEKNSWLTKNHFYMLNTNRLLIWSMITGHRRTLQVCKYRYINDLIPVLCPLISLRINSLSEATPKSHLGKFTSSSFLQLFFY